ncbi:hypothetical protein H8E65_01955 [Candidatus Bathyarchaeota archaeon]|nr:hypothetical protein [Candidatus Bathyarchaeota archaeon]
MYVEEKRDVPPEDMIPAIIDGVKTDVIQRKFVLHKGEEKLETNEP